MIPPSTPLSRALSILVGVWVGITIGQVVFTFLFFFMYLIGVPVGFVAGPILGGIWGNRNPLFRTAFAGFGVWVGLLIFVLGGKFLELPARSTTWFAAPILGLAAMFLLPLLAKRLVPEEKREKASIYRGGGVSGGADGSDTALTLFPRLTSKKPGTDRCGVRPAGNGFFAKGGRGGACGTARW